MFSLGRLVLSASLHRSLRFSCIRGSQALESSSSWPFSSIFLRHTFRNPHSTFPILHSAFSILFSLLQSCCRSHSACLLYPPPSSFMLHWFLPVWWRLSYVSSPRQHINKRTIYIPFSVSCLGRLSPFFLFFFPLALGSSFRFGAVSSCLPWDG